MDTMCKSICESHNFPSTAFYWGSNCHCIPGPGLFQITLEAQQIKCPSNCLHFCKSNTFDRGGMCVSDRTCICVKMKNPVPYDQFHLTFVKNNEMAKLCDHICQSTNMSNYGYYFSGTCHCENLDLDFFKGLDEKTRKCSKNCNAYCRNQSYELGGGCLTNDVCFCSIKLKSNIEIKYPNPKPGGWFPEKDCPLVCKVLCERSGFNTVTAKCTRESVCSCKPCKPEKP